MRFVGSAVRKSDQFAELSNCSHSYLLLPNELWARAYAQFNAKRTGDILLLANIRYHLNRTDDDFFLMQQWDENDFNGIESAIEQLLKSEGLL